MKRLTKTILALTLLSPFAHAYDNCAARIEKEDAIRKSAARAVESRAVPHNILTTFDLALEATYSKYPLNFRKIDPKMEEGCAEANKLLEDIQLTLDLVLAGAQP